jgi:hypothetical protein
MSATSMVMMGVEMSGSRANIPPLMAPGSLGMPCSSVGEVLTRV